MRVVGRVGAGGALVLLAAAAAMVLWPVHRAGLSGSALTPHYGEVGFWLLGGDRHLASPVSVVDHRRGLAMLLAAIAVAVLCCVLAIRYTRSLARVALMTIAPAVAIAAAVLIWPVHINGLDGSALVPHYTGIGWIGSPPTAAQFAHPYDLVAGSRHLAELVIAFGLAAAVVAIAVQRRWRVAR